jgi:hypothetical protein
MDKESTQQSQGSKQVSTIATTNLWELQEAQRPEVRGSTIGLIQSSVPTNASDGRQSTLLPSQTAYLPTESIHDKPLEESDSFL